MKRVIAFGVTAATERQKPANLPRLRTKLLGLRLSWWDPGHQLKVKELRFSVGLWWVTGHYALMWNFSRVTGKWRVRRRTEWRRS